MAASSSLLPISLSLLLLLICLAFPDSSGRPLTDRRGGVELPDQQQQPPFRRGQYTDAIRWNITVGSKPRTLTYALSSNTSYGGLGREDVLAALRGSAGRWEAVIPLRFQETPDFSNADVKIEFYEGEPGGRLAYASHMDERCGAYIGIDAMEHWTTDLGKDKERRAMDLETVLVHELGHVLGLGHTTTRRAVMYPTYSWRERKVELHKEDIQAVQEIFRSKHSIIFSCNTTSAIDP